jgi:hypothetical protein
MSDDDSIYKVMFHNQGQIYEVYAKNIYQSELYGFIEVEDYVFGKPSQMVIDPAEDKLRTEFEGVQRSFIPMHTVIRIDEVEREGQPKITDTKGDKVTPFPMMMPRDSGPRGRGQDS